jgi:antigen flippase
MSDQQSKKEILKSTGILGSVQVLNIFIGILRIKVLAILLGPLGVGIAGIYQATVTIISSASGFGINFSGVRDIASASASGDGSKISRTVLILRRWALMTGLFGMLVMLIFCKPLSRLAFDDESYAWGIALLSIAVLLSALTGGNNALLQGMRQIRSMAKANIIGALLGLAGSVTIYYLWGLKGIVPALLLTFLTAQVAAWYFARNVSVNNVSLSLKDTYRDGLSMAKLGFFMVLATLMNHSFMYVVRAFIVQRGGLELAGYFIAAWTISATYIAAIFGAMGADFYPRLCVVQDDNRAVKKLVNEQTEIALLLTVPLIIGIISFIRLFVDIFYSKDFGATATILSWQLFGDFFKVLAYPIGFILLAKAKGKTLIAVELIWNLIFLGLIFFGWKYFGVKITGIAFLISYIIYLSVLFFSVKRLVGFSWTDSVVRYMAVFLTLLSLSFLSSIFLQRGWQQYTAGTVLFGAATSYSFYHLKKIINVGAFVKKLKAKFF